MAITTVILAESTILLLDTVMAMALVWHQTLRQSITGLVRLRNMFVATFLEAETACYTPLNTKPYYIQYMSSKYPGYKHFFLDVETTGLDTRLHDIFQISGIITDANLNILESVDYRFCPFTLDTADPEALVKTGMTAESLSALPLTPREAYAGLNSLLERHCDRFNKLDKLHFVAYNAKFDADFIRAFFEKNGDNYFGSWFWNPPICVMQAAAWMTMRVRGALPNFKLGTLCQCAELGWDEAAAHDASYDIHKTLELYQYLRRDIPQL